MPNTLQNGFADFMSNARTTAAPSQYAISPERADAIRNAPTVPFNTPSAAPMQSSVPADSPFFDHAENILTPAPITQDQKADLYDHYHGSKTAAELATRIASLDVPDQLKHDLWTAKQASGPAQTHVDQVTAAIQRMTTIDPKTLELAETHPNILKHVTNAALQEEN